MKICNVDIDSTATRNDHANQFKDSQSSINNFLNNLIFFHTSFIDLKLSGKALLHSIEKRNKHFHNLNAV
jgi:hypothetical protein